MDKHKKDDLIKGIGYLLVNVAIQKLRDRSNAVTCVCCEEKRTNYMTICCHQPICYDCFSNFRSYQESHFRSLGRTSDWGETTFVCPFCGQEKKVHDYDPDSMAAK